MPTVLRKDGYRFFFWSNEGTEPPHIHVEKGDAIGKWWLTNLTMVEQEGFKAAQLRRIREILAEHRQELLEAWNDHFG